MKKRSWLMALMLVGILAAITATAADNFPRVTAPTLKTIEADGKELAIIDPREEGVFGAAHLLHAVNLPLSKLELNIFRMVPRKSTRIVLTDGGDGMAERAATKLKEFGYTDVAILDGGVP